MLGSAFVGFRSASAAVPKQRSRGRYVCKEIEMFKLFLWLDFSFSFGGCTRATLAEHAAGTVTRLGVVRT